MKFRLPGDSPNKYGARRATVDGWDFDSRAEAARYAELKLLAGQGIITGLRVHPAYPLIVEGVAVGNYVGDFSYTDDKGVLVLEDVKGVRTQLYKFKRKLVLALYGIDIQEVDV